MPLKSTPVEKQRITIIGTGCIGSSMGLAIRRSKDASHLEVVGHDKNPSRARRALRQEAFDRVALNLSVALKDAQLVILAVPLASLRDVLSDVGRLLAEMEQTGVVVTDTGPLKVPAGQWADELLPTGVYYVGGDPFLAPGAAGWEPLRGLVDAREDLFEEAVYAVTARAEDHPSAVRTVTNLALTLRATPHFMDPVEHDAVRTLTGAVPNLVGTALFRAVADQPGWQEVRKAATRDFATATAAASGDIASRRMMAILNREALVRGLDAVEQQIQALRRMVEENDVEALESRLAATAEDRIRWIAESTSRSWQVDAQSIQKESLFERTLQALLGESFTGKREA
jgi:prephenate dehydrogenase